MTPTTAAKALLEQLLRDEVAMELTGRSVETHMDPATGGALIGVALDEIRRLRRRLDARGETVEILDLQRDAEGKMCRIIKSKPPEPELEVDGGPVG